MDFSRVCTAPDSPISLEAEKSEQKSSWSRRWSKKLGWSSKDDTSTPCSPTPNKEAFVDSSPAKAAMVRAPWTRKKVVANLPRNTTFQRQNSEKRERLVPAEPKPTERRAASVGKKRAMSARPASPKPYVPGKTSAPAVCHVANNGGTPSWPSNGNHDVNGNGFDNQQQQQQQQPPMPNRPTLPPSPPPEEGYVPPEMDMTKVPHDGDEEEDIQRELEERWILNLSMHFRDRSPREKFFVTFAETPTHWRRVTVSCDYRDTPPDSLERDLQKLSSQRDKSARIYEAIRLSLRDIQFYETVTNLKLQTTEDDRLHVHVTEDVNEIIPYPSLDLVAHLPPTVNLSPVAHHREEYTLRVPESEVHFEAHMSGFVYKVRVDGKLYIKKEIPGPDSIDEFLYEINALYALIGSKHVVQFRGLVVDPHSNVIKGLLIDYAEQGPLVDIIFDADHTIAIARRERWAYQIIQGLSEIHEAGFVQGDFTLSNICIDGTDSVRIIDINRRGCPVGWEPPEIAELIKSQQRISMLIGVKSDLFQLGMVLWALVEEEDEPERQPRPLNKETERLLQGPYPLQKIVKCCLDSDPKRRACAKDLLRLFPKEAQHYQSVEDIVEENPMPHTHSLLEPQERRGRGQSSRAGETEYINPADAVEREDIEPRHGGADYLRKTLSSDSRTYVDHGASSSNFRFDDTSSYIVPHARGRSPGRDMEYRDFGAAGSSSSYAGARTRSVGSQTYQHGGFRNVSSEGSRDDRGLTPNVLPISPSHDYPWVEIIKDGQPQIVEKASLELIDEDDLRELRREYEESQANRRGRNVVGAAVGEDYGFPHYSEESAPHGSVLGPAGGSAPEFSATDSRRAIYPAGRQVLSMEHVDSGLADMDIYGIGGNEALRMEGDREGVLSEIDEEEKWEKEQNGGHQVGELSGQRA